MDRVSVFVGCYERCLFKYSLGEAGDESLSNDEQPQLQYPITFRRTASQTGHNGPVKCLASMGSSVFSGGAGDAIRVYDTKSGLDTDSLVVPDAADVACLTLFLPSQAEEPTLLLNGCTDGSVHIWKRKQTSWKHQKRILFHKAAVSDVDIHSTGKMAFTVGRDRGLVLWDLVSNKRAFSCKLTVEATHVRFHPHSPENAVARLNVEDSSRFESWTQLADVQALCFWKRHRFLTAADDGAVRLWDDRCKDMAMEIPDAHASRIKGLDTFSSHNFVTGASNGEMKMWDLRKTKTSFKSSPLAKEETKARITCLVCAEHGETDSEPFSKKRTRADT